jgi:hypothetical protein
MHSALRPYATAGVALVGASIIAVSPVAPTPSPATVRTADVELTAASIGNVPANALLAALNTPANLVFGMQRFADAMAASGSWEVSQPNNVWGWDPANPEMLESFVDMLVPFPALSRPLGEHMNWWAAANLPMHEGCAFECTDPIGMLNSMFRVPMWKFYSPEGYTFGEVINPVDGKPTEWSGKTIKLDRFEVIKSVADYFTGEPPAFRPVTMYDFVTASANLAAALQITGHVPDWLAVREIETFVKLFIPKPENPAVEPVDYPEDPTAPAPGTLKLSAAAPKAVEADQDSPVLTLTKAVTTPLTSRPAAEVTETPKDAVDSETDEPERTAQDSVSEESAADQVADDADVTESSTGKPSKTERPKNAFSVKDTVESLQKKFASAVENSTQRHSSKATKTSSPSDGTSSSGGKSSSGGASSSAGGSED